MKTIYLALAALSGITAYAQPMLISSCPEAKNIRLPDNHNGFYMSADCKTAYVLPPAAGSVTLHGITGSATLGRCSELSTAIRTLRRITKELSLETKKKLNEVEAEDSSYNPRGPILGRRPIEEAPEVDLTDAEVVALYVKKKELMESVIRDFGNTPGAEASLLFSSDSGEILTKFRSMNKRLAINFMQVPVKETKLTFLSTTSEDKNLPIFLFANFPEGQAMNGSVSGKVVLSLLGACPLAGSFDTISPFVTTDQFTAALPARLEYQYDLVSTIHYRAEYHRGGLAENIRKNSTRGGFFDSKTISKYSTSTRTEDWFKYFYKCDDSRVCEEQHDNNIIAIKERLMGDVLSNIALMKFDYPLAPEAAGKPGETGAQVASENLKKCPNIYCQIAAGVLDVMQATLGSESKVDNYINKENHWAWEDVKENRAIPFTGTMGFIAKEF